MRHADATDGRRHGRVLRRGVKMVVRVHDLIIADLCCGGGCGKRYKDLVGAAGSRIDLLGYFTL